MLRGPVESRNAAGRTDDPPALLRDAPRNSTGQAIQLS